MATMAEFERALLVESTQAELQRAKILGKTLDRSRALSVDQEDKALPSAGNS